MKTREEIKQEIKNLESRIKELTEDLQTRWNFQMMYIEKKGKKYFVLQPKNQVQNLKSNGWKNIDKEKAIKIISDYEF